MAIINGSSGDDNLIGNNNEDDVIHGLEGNDTISGLSGNDDIYGDEGDDTLRGEEGDDRLYGGDGNDTLRGGDGADFLDGGSGGGSIYGGNGDDLILARGGGMSINGEDGNDTVRVHASGDGSIYGGLGTDTLIFDFSTATQGVWVDLTAMWFGNAATLRRYGGGGSSQLDGFEQIGSTIVGSAYSDRFVVGSGFAGALTFQMGEGDDEVEGGAGADTVFGGEGYDYLSGNDGDDELHGGLGNDTILGGTGADILHTGTGVDTLDGGHGDDIIHVSAGGGEVDGGAGTDWLTFSLLDSDAGVTMDLSGLWTGGVGSFAGRTITGIERLSTGALVGSNFNDFLTVGTGYTFGVTLEGRDGNDTLTGGDGTDILYGGGGNDWLDGLGGTNTLDGSVGNDTYLVSNGTTTVVEAAGAGTDTVRASITYSLGANVENLVLTSSGPQNGYGNAGDNTLTGGTGVNELYGGDGNDVVYGRGGWDFLFGGAGNDSLYGEEGSDYLISGSGNDSLYGGLGDDSIFLEGDGVHYADAGAGSYDALFIQVSRAGGNNIDLRALWSGGSGQVNGGSVRGFEVLGGALVNGTAFDDVYYFGSTYYFAEGAYTGAMYQSNGGNDYVEGTAGIDTFTGGSGLDSFYGHAGADHLSGGEGDDILNGGAGNDVLVGGNGADAYYVDSMGDQVDESSGSGFDTIYLTASLDYSLQPDIEAGVYFGGAYTGTLTGNDLDNLLVGGTQSGAPNGTLVGGAGNDRLQYGTVMRGGVGDDSYYLVNQGNGTSTIVELAGEGYDTVYFFQSSYVLPDNIEAAVGGWEGGVQITGNAGNNRITSNSGAFADTIWGLGGDDELILGPAAINGQLHGGDGNDRLYGAYENDTLYGDLGDDFLDGGAGNDHLYGGAGSNRIIGGAGTDIAFFDGNLSQYEILSLGDALIVMGPNGKTQVSGVELLRFADGDVDPLLITCYPPGSGGNGALTGAPLVLPGLVEADKVARPPVLPRLDDMDPLVLPPVADAAVVGDEPIVCRPDTFRFDPVDFDLDPPDLALMPGPRGPLGLMAVPFDNDWII
ncbi:MAG: hypothetical protein J0L52_04985 [Caulobacterales bacterium]|nr:hypothetical protein [Caulobacterales bacterium]